MARPGLPHEIEEGAHERRLFELRMMLVQGKVRESRALAQLLDAQSARRKDPRANHLRSVGELASAIEALSSGDITSASPFFEPALDVSSPIWVRWVGSFWLAAWQARAGALDEAEERGADAMDLARQLDDEALLLTECLFGELEAYDGAIQPALDRVASAMARLESTGSVRGVALAWLTRARILSLASLQDEAAAAAERAYAIEPTWETAALFRSQQLLHQGDLQTALAVLTRLPDPRSPEVQRSLQVLSLVKAGRVPLWVVAELQTLRNELPSESSVNQLRVLVNQASQLPHARETLGWKLFQLGHFDEACAIFSSFTQEEISGTLRETVLLGQRCTLNARQRRVRLAEQAQEKTPTTGAPPPVPDRDSDQDQDEITAVGNSFRGALSLLPAPELLEFLRASQRSGLLVFAKGEEIGTICLRRGQVAGSTSPGYLHLGEQLQEAGVISAEACAQLRPQEPFAALGWVPVPEELASREQIMTAFERQTRLSIKELVQWSSGSFSFEPRNPCRTVGPGLRLDTQGVLLDALRQIDEENAGLA